MIRKEYESYIIVDGNYEDVQIEEIIKKFENLLKKNEAEVKNIDRIGRRRMAYAIKKVQNGYYVCFEYTGGNEVVAKLERGFKLDENILRYLTITLSKKTIAERTEHFKKKALIAEKLSREAAEREQALALEAEKENAPEVE